MINTADVTVGKIERIGLVGRDCRCSCQAVPPMMRARGSISLIVVEATP